MVLVTCDLLTLELLCVCVLLFLVFFLLLLSAFIANKRVHVTRGTEQTTFLSILVLLRLFLVELWANVTHQTDDVTLTLTFDL